MTRRQRTLVIAGATALTTCRHRDGRSGVCRRCLTVARDALVALQSDAVAELEGRPVQEHVGEALRPA